MSSLPTEEWKAPDSVSLSSEEPDLDMPRIQITFAEHLLSEARSSEEPSPTLERANPILDLLLSPGVSLLNVGPIPRSEGPVSRDDMTRATRAGAYRREDVRARIDIEDV